MTSKSSAQDKKPARTKRKQSAKGATVVTKQRISKKSPAKKKVATVKQSQSAAKSKIKSTSIRKKFISDKSIKMLNAKKEALMKSAKEELKKYQKELLKLKNTKAFSVVNNIKIVKKLEKILASLEEKIIE